MASQILIDRTLIFRGGDFVAHIRVLEVDVSTKFPGGIKAKYILVDTKRNVPRLLVDNHEPYGYHMHTHLPEDKNIRLPLEVKGYNQALSLFLEEARKVLRDEK